LDNKFSYWRKTLLFHFLLYPGIILDNNDPFKKYGLKRTINAATCLTILGGSKPDPMVFEAMIDASEAFIYIPELQNWVGERLAQAFGSEAGLPTAGAVNGLMLACAACMMRGTGLEDYNPLSASRDWTELIQRLPGDTQGLPKEFVVMADSRSQYDHAIKAAGGIPVEAGSRAGVTVEDLHSMYNPGETAAYYYTLYAFKDQIPLREFVEVAHSYDLPAMIDAAPTLTHQAIPRKILDSGADLVIFSGGKQLGGPNNTGILLGRRDLITLAHLQAYPFDGIGRAAKMSRETIIGLVTALDLFMKRDDETYYRDLLKETKSFSEELGGINGLRSGVLFEPSILEDVVLPSYAWVEMKTDKITLSDLHEKLLNGDPRIRTLYEPFFITNEAGNRITFKTEYLVEGDKEIILERLQEIMN
jgi:L-seryl-tRNA(Ser) seleniumtransferase